MAESTLADEPLPRAIAIAVSLDCHGVTIALVRIRCVFAGIAARGVGGSNVRISGKDRNAPSAGNRIGIPNCSKDASHAGRISIY